MASGAIITGAASGLGLALAKNLLEKGWRVVMSDISPSGAKTATELQASNPAYEGKVLWVQSDVTDWDSQVRMFEKAFSWCPKITFLAANAGIVSTACGMLTTEISKPDLKVLDINLVGVSYSVKLFMAHIHQVADDGAEVRGRIVVTASEGGLYALPTDPVYCASKHALVGLVRSIGPTYWLTHRITVNALAPGYMPTPLTAAVGKFIDVKYATPLSTAMSAFDDLMCGTKTGQILEISGKNSYFREQATYPNEIARWIWEDMGDMLWDIMANPGSLDEVKK